jgi:hypothetical protein
MEVVPAPSPARRGLVLGTIHRYGDTGRALFPAIDEMIERAGLSVEASAKRLADEVRIAGRCTAENRVTRLAKAPKGKRWLTAQCGRLATVPPRIESD